MRISICVTSALLMAANGFAAEMRSHEVSRMTNFHFLVHDERQVPAKVLVDYTGSCGGTYTCANGTQLNCPSNARPAEFLGANQCYCEYASTCQ
ncbi:hypothetical protein EV132_1032 [Rhizobium sullae]|uniref:Uncharacterized protein n=1 Tax=Rhizobium sullae TaxID=50338 RepID=A0A4R3QI41_RHISU|nr:hypothetical protein EV132_1032 [Rhizobium sullae]